MRNRTRGQLIPIAVGVGGAAAAWLARDLFVRVLGAELPPYITFYPAVMAVALMGGAAAGSAATATAAALAAYSILPPAGWAVSDAADVMGLALFTVMGIFMTIVAELYRRSRARAEISAAELAALESERRLKRFHDAGLLGVIYWNVNGQITGANDRFLATVGYTREDLAAGALNWMALTPPEYRPRDEQALGELKATGVNAQPFEKEYIRKDGTRVPIVVAGAMLEENGTDGVALVLDITERRRAQQALRDSEQRFRTMVDAIPQLAWVARADGWIYWYNRGWYEYTGTTPEQMEGWGWQSVHDPQALSAVLERWRRSIATGEPFDMVFPLRGADGVFRSFLTRVTPFKDEHGAVVEWFGTNTDVDELKRVERELSAAKQSAERAKAAAEEANRAKDHFLAVLSHELRTPLTPVLTGIAMLQNHPGCDGRMHDTVEMLRRNIEMEARLIDDLLDVTRIARGAIDLDRKPVRLCEVIERAVEVCRPDIEARRLHFGVDFGPCAPYIVHADPARLQQVFWNLLKNAVKFTPRGGCVGIRCYPDNQTVVAEVNDSGVGIEPENLSRVFNAFEQVNRADSRQFGGLGLGLAIARSLVEMHGGRIEAYSDGVQKGSTFRVALPVMADVALEEIQPVAPSAGLPTAQSSLHILLVEDHGDTAQMMEMLLTATGYRVQLAGDVATALEEAGRNSFDLLLSDLGLPDGTGADLMRELRRRGHKMPGIALSGYGREDDIERSRAAGFVAHLVKPASPDRLIETIAVVAGRAER